MGCVILGRDGPCPQAHRPPRRRADRRRAARGRPGVDELQRLLGGPTPAQLADAEAGRELPAHRPRRRRARTSASGNVHTFRVRERAGSGVACPCATRAACPDPFREGREIIVTVRKGAGGTFVGEQGLAHHEVPVEVHRRTSRPRPPADGDPRAGPHPARARRRALRHRRRARSARAAAGATSSTPRRRSVYAVAGLTTGAFVILEIAFLRSDFAFEVVADHSSTTTPPFYQVTAVVVLAGGLAAAVGLAAVAVVEPRALPHAQAPARRRPVRDRGAARLRARSSARCSRSSSRRSRSSRSCRPRARASTRCCATRA